MMSAAGSETTYKRRLPYEPREFDRSTGRNSSLLALQSARRAMMNRNGRVTCAGEGRAAAPDGPCDEGLSRLLPRDARPSHDRLAVSAQDIMMRLPAISPKANVEPLSSELQVHHRQVGQPRRQHGIDVQAA